MATPMFARRHYDLIASTIRAVYEVAYAAQADYAERMAVDVTAMALADQFEADNPAFDRARFMRACGMV